MTVSGHRLPVRKWHQSVSGIRCKVGQDAPTGFVAITSGEGDCHGRVVDGGLPVITAGVTVAGQKFAPDLADEIEDSEALGR